MLNSNMFTRARSALTSLKKAKSGLVDELISSTKPIPARAYGKTFSHHHEVAIQEFALNSSKYTPAGMKDGVKAVGHLADLAHHINPAGAHAELHASLNELKLDHLKGMHRTQLNLHAADAEKAGISLDQHISKLKPAERLQHETFEAFNVLPPETQRRLIKEHAPTAEWRHRLFDPKGVEVGNAAANTDHLTDFSLAVGKELRSIGRDEAAKGLDHLMGAANRQANHIEAVKLSKSLTSTPPTRTT